MTYRLWVNEQRTVMIEMWENGVVTVTYPLSFSPSA